MPDIQKNIPVRCAPEILALSKMPEVKPIPMFANEGKR